MPTMPGSFRPDHLRDVRERKREQDAKRRRNHEYRKWYNTAAWRKMRASHLAQEPICRRCKAKGIVNDGSLTIDGKPQSNRRRRHLVVNHIGGHKGDWDRFVTGPFETLCPDHHDIVVQAEERGGKREEIDPLTGLPVE